MDNIESRTELLVSTFSLKQVKTLKKYGDIRYISRKMHYVILFVDSDNLEDTIANIKKARFVKRVDIAPTIKLVNEFNELNENFEEDE